MPKSISILFLFLIFGCCTDLNEKEKIEKENKIRAESYVETIWNNKDIDSLNNFFSPNFIRNVNDIDMASDNSELAANIQNLFIAFPDLHLTIDQIKASEEMVFIDFNIKGTNTGPYGDLGVTGKKVDVNGVSRIDFNENGKIIHETIFYNELSLLQQLGYELNEPKID